MRGQHDGVSVSVGILDDDLVALLQEPHTTGVAGVGLGGGAGGVGHCGAGHPGHVVHQDLEGVDLVVVQVVYLGVDKVNPRRSDPDRSVLDRKFPLHLHPLRNLSHAQESPSCAFPFLVSAS